MARGLRQPEHLQAAHDCNEFENGRHPSLDQWLRDHAAGSEGLSSRTYVVCPANAPQQVIGYYAISAALAERSALPGAKLRRGMPQNVPLLLIGRLAVDRRWQGMGLGKDLLDDALTRCLGISQTVGVRAISVHAIDDAAVAFYLKHGFLESPIGERLMLLPIETARLLFPRTRS